MRYLQVIGILLFLLVFNVHKTGAQNFQEEIPADYGYSVSLGQTVPDFDLVLPDDTYIPIRDLRGKVVMLQFTASWCSVCRKEMPHIEKEIWQKHKENANFKLFGIDLKEPVETVVAFQKQVGISYPLALDANGSVFEKFTVPNAGVTRNIIIDRNGTIVFLTRLFKEEEFNRMKEVIDKLLRKDE